MLLDPADIRPRKPRGLAVRFYVARANVLRRFVSKSVEILGSGNCRHIHFHSIGVQDRTGLRLHIRVRLHGPVRHCYLLTE